MNIDRFVLQISNETVTSPFLGNQLEADFRLGKKQLRKIHELVEKLAGGEKGLSSNELQTLGEYLFNALMNGEIRKKFFELYQKVSNTDSASLRLELIFTEKARAFAELPWEFICVPKPDRIAHLKPFLAVSDRVALVRNIFNAPHKNLSRLNPAEKLRVGMAISKPHIWFDDLDDLGEVDDQPVLDALADLSLKTRESFQLDTNKAFQVTASKNNIRNLLAKYKPHILHYIGHGDMSEKHAGAVLILVDDETVDVENARFATAVTGKEICALFEEHRPDVVILQSCNTARGGSAKGYSNMAYQIAKAGIPLVIAMQYEIQNSRATDFSKKLYESLIAGRSVEEAVNLARRYLYDLSVDRDFGTPVIYITTPESRLFARTAYEASFEEMANELVSLPGMNDLELSLIRKIYANCFEGLTLISPLSINKGGVQELLYHLAQATPLQDSLARPLAFFAATLAHQLPWSRLELVEALYAWLSKYAVDLSIDPDNLDALIRTTPEQTNPPCLQLILEPYPDQPTTPLAEQPYILKGRDGRKDRVFYTGEKMMYKKLAPQARQVIKEFQRHLDSDEADFDDKLWIEFWLSTADLSRRKVDQWKFDLEKGKTFGQCFKVVVRSRYRWEKLFDLRKCWPSKWGNCKAAMSKKHPVNLASIVIKDATMTALKQAVENVEVLGLAFEPNDDAKSGNMLTTVLDSGVPVVIWVRPGVESKLAEQWLLNKINGKLDLLHLAEHVRLERQNGGDMGNVLVLLWDNYDHRLDDLENSLRIPEIETEEETP